MKRIARTLVIVTIAVAATAATAADTPFPSSAQDQYPLSQVFPDIDTYKREHHDSIANQVSVPYPSAGMQSYPLSSEFPDTVTYEQQHENDPVQVSTTPTFPYSVPAEPSFADEGLVPGIAGVAPYDNRGAVGATR